MAHAKDEAPKSFYAHVDYLPLLSDPVYLFMLLEDARRIVS